MHKNKHLSRVESFGKTVTLFSEWWARRGRDEASNKIVESPGSRRLDMVLVTFVHSYISYTSYY